MTRAHIVRAIAIFAASITTLAGAIAYSVLRTQAVAVTESQLHRAVLGSCTRVQILRDQVNTSNVATYNAFVYAAELTEPQNPKGGGVFRALAKKIMYLPRTDCNQAVERPLTYAPPHAVPLGDGTHQIS